MKAEDVKILDMHELVTYTDYLVLCTGRNTRLTRRIAEEIGFKLKQEYGLLPAGIEGDGRRRVDPHGLPGLHGPRLHARGAGVLPAGRAVEAGAGRDGGVSRRRAGRADAPRLAARGAVARPSGSRL